VFLGVDVNLNAAPNTEILLIGLPTLPVVFASLPCYMAMHPIVHRWIKHTGNHLRRDPSGTPV
jgi:hypothetical protein